MPARRSVSGPLPIVAFLDRVHLAPRQACKQLTLWPLVLRSGAKPPTAPEYVPLAQALADGSCRVEELGSGASVPQISVTNRGPRAVLVLFGEELRGALQNRVANASFLVPAGEQVEIDVSCVEQGRWHRAPARQARRAPRGYTGDERLGFETSGSVMSHAIRKKMARKVREARSSGRGFTSDQLEVWSLLADRHARTATRSDTGAYADYVTSRASALAEIHRSLQPVAGQVGFVAQIGDGVVGVEAIGRPEVFAHSFERLVDAYAVDAIDYGALDPEDAPARPRFGDPESLLAALAQTRPSVFPSLGLGQDWRLEGRGLEGCALVADDLVHLAVSVS